MITLKEIQAIAESYNIEDNKWVEHISNEVSKILEKKEFLQSPFKINKIRIKKFASPQYGEVTGSPDGRSFLIWGSHRTGKSTTYDALLYALAGRGAPLRDTIGEPDVFVALSNGSTEIEILRKYGQSLQVKINKNPYDGDKAVAVLKEYTGLNHDDFRSFRCLTLPQRSETDSILQNLNPTQFSSMIYRFGSDKTSSILKELLQSKLIEIENKIRDLEIQNSDISYNENDLKQRISSTKYRIKELEDYKKKYESGELKEIVMQIKENPEIKNKLKKLENEFQQLWREEVHLREFVNAIDYRYTNKTPEEIVENVLVKIACPVCEANVDIERIKTRIKHQKSCPLCNESYSWEIVKKAKSKVEEAQKAEELKERITAIDQRKKEIEEEKRKLNFEHSHETIRKIIKEEISEKDYEKNKESLSETQTLLNDDNKELDKLKLAKEQNSKNRTELTRQKAFIESLISKIAIAESSKAAEEDFENKVNNFFEAITDNLSNIKYENGDIYLVEKYGTMETKRNARNKYEISVGERRALDISIVFALFLMNRQSRYYNLDFLILDDLTEGIMDVNWKKNLIRIVEEINGEIQIISTSCDNDIKQLDFGSFTNLKLQKTLPEFMKN